MIFRVYKNGILHSEKIVLIKANAIGVALKDNFGATEVLVGVYITEVDGIGGFVNLLTSQPEAQEKQTPIL